MILITGASRGIGAYLFGRYSSQGENVLGTAFNSVVSDKRISTVDVSEYQQVYQWIDSIDTADLTDITLISCAGIPYSCMVHKSIPEEWSRVISVNLIGNYNVIRTLLPIMRDQSFGRIICFSSVVGELGVPGTSAYAASKTGLTGLVRTLAKENGHKNITANTINLGYASMGMGEHSLSDSFKHEIQKKIPAGRFCFPEEIWEAVEFMRTNAYINGAGINLNGGLL